MSFNPNDHPGAVGSGRNSGEWGLQVLERLLKKRGRTASIENSGHNASLTDVAPIFGVSLTDFSSKAKGVCGGKAATGLDLASETVHMFVFVDHAILPIEHLCRSLDAVHIVLADHVLENFQLRRR